MGAPTNPAARGGCACLPTQPEEHFVTSEPAYGAPTGEGWLTFAGIMIIVLGTLNVIWGIAAIDRSAFFVGETQLIFDDLRTWGWIVLIIGALQVLAGFGIFARNQLARWFGIAVAAINLLAALTSIEAYPFWALVIIGIDILVIYALAAYGDRLSTPA
jgi:hypothetical protein